MTKNEEKMNKKAKTWKNMKKMIEEYWKDRNFFLACLGPQVTEKELEKFQKQTFNTQLLWRIKRERVKCDICGCQLQRGSLSRHKKTKKCQAHSNDKYILVDGRTYLKGESPLEGVWHSDHTPFEVKKYVIFEKGVPRGITIKD